MTRSRPPARTLLLALLIPLTSVLPALAQDKPHRFELFGGYSLTQNDGAVPFPGTFPGTAEDRIGQVLAFRRLPNTHGWNGSVTYYLTRRFGLVADFEGQYSPGSAYTTVYPPNFDWQSESRSHSHSVLFGPRFSLRPNGRVRPFVQGMVGVTRLNDRASGRGRTAVQYYEFEPGIGFEQRTDVYDLQFLENRVKANSPTVSAGGGVDLRLSRHVAVRLIQMDVLAKRGRARGQTTYMLQGANEASVRTYRTDLFDQHNIRVSYGLVFTF